MKLQDLKFEARCCVLGEQGTGKTRFLGTLCALLPTCLVTADGQGLATLRGGNYGDPEVVLIESWDAIWDYHSQIQGHIKNGARALALDDFGGVQGLMARKLNMLPDDKEAKNAPAVRQDLIRQAMLQGNRRLMLQQWGQLALGTESWLHELLALPVQIKVMTMLTELRTHPRTGDDHLYPDVLGHFRDAVLGNFSLVANTFTARYKGGSYWCMTTRPHPRIPTKDRYATPRTWVDPVAARLLGHVNGKEEPETDLERTIGTGIDQ